MSETTTVFAEKLKHTGLWDFKEFYNFCFLWLRDEGYIVEEHEYNEKILSGGKEIVIKWKAWRKISDYFKYIIKVNWRILRMQDVEIELENGNKGKTNKGEVELKVEGQLEKDWEDRWERSPSYKFFRGIYDKYIIRTTTDQYEDDLADKCASFVSQCKAFLDLGGR